MNDLSYRDFEDVLRRSLPFLDASAPVDPDAGLTELGLDSLTLLTLVTELEETLAVELPDEMLVMDTFSTPSALWEKLSELRRSA
ncbi:MULTISPECIES: phosphopantetheine-binding protein [unclassified Streptomyces]|uniref:phosphopantetheine-binding protein n=1 Tax=unclassified Streptomyces TaxID=2593676 RepID=UPI003800F1F3